MDVGCDCSGHWVLHGRLRSKSPYFAIRPLLKSQIFSVNMVNPMIGIVYYNNRDNLPRSYGVAMSIATLSGALVGQVVFGIAADIWGRRKMYGLELVVLIFTTLGVAFASQGAHGSMDIMGLLIFWRFFMGFGLGGDYPLSAVICAE